MLSTSQNIKQSDMINYIVPVGFGFFFFWSEILIQKHFQVNSKAFSESFDEHLCLSPYNRLRDQPDVPGEIFQRHQEGSGARGSTESQGVGAPPSVGP